MYYKSETRVKYTFCNRKLKFIVLGVYTKYCSVSLVFQMQNIYLLLLNPTPDISHNSDLHLFTSEDNPECGEALVFQPDGTLHDGVSITATTTHSSHSVNDAWIGSETGWRAGSNDQWQRFRVKTVILTLHLFSICSFQIVHVDFLLSPFHCVLS